MSTVDNSVSVTFTLYRGTPPPAEAGKGSYSYIIFELGGYNIQGYTRERGGYIMNGDRDVTFYGDDELMEPIAYVEEKALAQAVRLALGISEED